MVYPSTSVSNASLRPEKACTLRNTLMYNQDYGTDFEVTGNNTKSIELDYSQIMISKNLVCKRQGQMCFDFYPQAA